MPQIEIVPYQPHYREAFGRLNRAWLEKYFVVEPIDAQVLGDPETYILAKGGAILVALEDNLTVGVVALKQNSPGVYEMTKMAVDEAYQGKGYGEMLCKAAIEKARQIRAEHLILYSHTSLKPAIALYRKLGWKEIPVGESLYARTDIKMEYPL